MRAAVIVGLTLLLTACQPAPRTPLPPEPRAVAATPTPAAPPPATPSVPGFDVLEVDPTAGLPLHRNVRVVAARGDLEHVAVKVVVSPRDRQQWRTAADVARHEQALATINGGYFDERNRPLGLIVSDGEKLNPLRRADWGVFTVTGGKARIVHTKHFGSASRVDQALQCGPRLVVAGTPVTLKASAPEARSAVGVDDDGRVILAATQHGGLTLGDFAATLARPVTGGGLGCVDATNLDGGPSTQLSIPGRVEIEGSYGMPTHLVMLPSAAHHNP